jgi:hypothetical protein
MQRGRSESVDDEGDAMADQDLQTTMTELAHTKPISPGMHAVLDYSVAGTYLSVGAWLMNRHRRAATLALINGFMVLGMSMLTNYPGGLWPRLSFKTHRTGDIGQAMLAGLGPALFGFANDPEASFFYGQAASEVGVIAATDWEAAP